MADDNGVCGASNALRAQSFHAQTPSVETKARAADADGETKEKSPGAGEGEDRTKRRPIARSRSSRLLTKLGAMLTIRAAPVTTGTSMVERSALTPVTPVLGRVRLLANKDMFHASLIAHYGEGGYNGGCSAEKLAHVGEVATCVEVFGDTKTLIVEFDDGQEMDFPFETVASQETKENIFKLGEERTELSVDEIPEEGGVVDCSMCTKLTAVTGQWPNMAGITKIILSGCEKLTAVPERWPTSATTIILDNCDSLTKVPEQWPTLVKKISLKNCEKLAALPEQWPTSAKTISLNNCEKLTALPVIPPAACRVGGLTSLPASVHNIFNYFNSFDSADREAAACLAAHLQRSTTDLPVVEKFLESFLVDDCATTDDGESKGDGKENGGDGEKRGRFVTCSRFQDFVGGSFVAPVWPADKETEEAKTRMLAALKGTEERQSLELMYTQKKTEITVDREQRILEKYQINLPDSASRTDASSGNARLTRLTRITHLSDPAHDFLGHLLALPPWAQARLFQSEVSLTLFGRTVVFVCASSLCKLKLMYARFTYMLLLSPCSFSSIIPEHIYPLLPPSPFLRPPSSVVLPLYPPYSILPPPI